MRIRPWMFFFYRLLNKLIQIQKYLVAKCCNLRDNLFKSRAVGDNMTPSDLPEIFFGVRPMGR